MMDDPRYNPVNMILRAEGIGGQPIYRFWPRDTTAPPPPPWRVVTSIEEEISRRTGQNAAA